jgi:WD40 repeat protein
MAEQSAIEAEGEQGRQALLHGESNEAVHHLERAYRRGDRSAGTEFMLARALQPRMSELGRLASSAGRMWSAVFSPDGKRIITTDDDGAQMWDAGSNQVLFSMRHGDTVYDAGYSTDGSRVVTAGADGSVRVWDASTGAAIHRLSWRGLERQMRYYKVIATTRFVAAIDWKGHATHIWDLRTGAAVAQLENEASEAASLALSADERWLATSGGEVVRVFDTSTWKLAVTIAGPRVRSLAFETSGTRLAVGTYDGEASIWEVPSGARLRHLRQLGRPIDAIGFSANGALVAAGSRDGGVQVWDASSGALWSQATPHRGQVHRVEFSPKGDLLLSAGADGSVVISNVATGQSIDRLEGPKDVVFGAHFDGSAHRVVGASWDGTARLWDVAPPYHRWGAPPVGPECDKMDNLEPDGRFVALSCPAHGTRVWDTARGELLGELPGVTPVPGDYFSAFPALTVSGDRAAIARGNAVEVYALPSGQLIRTVTHPAAVNAVAFAFSGHDLVSGAIDGSLFVTTDGHEPLALATSPAGIDAIALMPDGRVVAADASARLRVIDPKRNVVLMELEAPTRVRLLRPSPDGRRLVTISVRSKQAPPVLWDVDAGRILTQLQGHVGRVFSARFVADGRQVLTAGRDGTARLWNAATGAPLKAFRGDTAFLVDAAVSPDSATVVGGGGDGVLRFWDAATGRLLWKLQAHTSYIVGVHYEGSDIVTRGFAGDVSRWTLPQPQAVIEACQANGCASTPGTGE